MTIVAITPGSTGPVTRMIDMAEIEEAQRVRKSEIWHAQCEAFHDSTRNIEEFSEYKVILEVEGKEPITYECNSFDESRGFIDDLIEEAFEKGEEEITTITESYVKFSSAVKFSGNILKKDRQRKEEAKRIAAEKEAAKQKKFDDWNVAMDWAREHGVKLRRGKVNKHLARVRIYESGLMEQWNAAWPDFKFDKKDVDCAKEFLEERESFYANKKNHKTAKKVRK